MQNDTKMIHVHGNKLLLRTPEKVKLKSVLIFQNIFLNQVYFVHCKQFEVFSIYE